MYEAPSVRAVRAEAQRLLAALFEAYRADPGRLPPEWRPADAAGAARAIGDFIAGMTDRYAIGQYRDLIGPARLPEGF
jgi:dGTPase